MSEVFHFGLGIADLGFRYGEKFDFISTDVSLEPCAVSPFVLLPYEL